MVIGSGPNGLVAANLLADQGWDVLVLEASSSPGGAVRSAELVEPGYTNDCFSSFFPLAVASPAIAGLGLGDHGLRWMRSQLVLAHPARDGSCPVVSSDLDETAASLEGLCSGDGAAWRHLYGGWERAGATLLRGVLSPFPPVRAGLSLAATVGPTEAAHLARFCMVPVRRLGEEELSGEASRRLLAGAALHADLSPEAALSGLYGWILCCLAQSCGWPVAEGGAGRVTDALMARLASRGGRVLCGTPVSQVVVRSGRAVAVRTSEGTEIASTRAVLADVPAPALYLELVGREHLPEHLLDDVARRFRWDASTVKVDWTLEGPIPWSAAEARRAGTVHVSDSVDELTVSSALLAAGVVPARPFLVVGQPGIADPSRHPRGKSCAWAYTRVPRRVKGDAGGGGIKGAWDRSDTDEIVERMEAAVEELAPGFRDRIRGRHVMAPPGLEAADPSLVGGSIGGGTAELYQQGIFRPVPGNGRPGTPVRGLFLASSSAHPGGGVHGACGANAARSAVWADRRRRFAQAVGRAAERSSRRRPGTARRPDHPERRRGPAPAEVRRTG